MNHQIFERKWRSGASAPEHAWFRLAYKLITHLLFRGVVDTVPDWLLPVSY